MTDDSVNSYAWDANGRPVTADGVGLTYDALGRMVEQNSSGSYTQIAYTPAQAKLALMSGSTLQKGFVPLAGGSVAVYNSSGLIFYRHSDWLGTSRVASTPSQTVYYDGATAPFGESYAQTGTADVSFTGQNQDTASTLYDFPAREYGQNQGRWPSPDPAGVASASLVDPQTWNRYAYVRNSPLSNIDPNGLCTDDFGNEEWPDGNIGNDSAEDSGICSNVVIDSPDGVYGSDPCDGNGGYDNCVSVSANSDPCDGNGGYDYCVSVSADNDDTCDMSDPQCQLEYESLTQGQPNVLQNAPSNGTPWYQNTCITGALKTGAVNVGIDALGFLPEAGGVARVVGHQAGYVGKVADNVGKNMLTAGTETTGFLNSATGFSSSDWTTWVSAGITAADFVPVLSDFTTPVAMAWDAGVAAYKVYQCPK